MIKAIPSGKKYVVTEPGESLSVIQSLGKIILPNGQAAQVKRAFVTAAHNDTTALLVANADAAFRILSLFMLAGGTAATVTFKSGTDAISPPLTNAANGGAVLPPNPHGWLQTNVINEALNVTVDDTSDVAVLINYIEIPQDCFDSL